MSWQSVSFQLPRDHADEFGDALLAAGAISVNVEDADEGTQDEKPIFGEPGADSGLWDLCRLMALLMMDADVEGILQEASKQVGATPGAVQLSILDDIDWVKNNREQFQPIQISQRLWIVPTWHLDTHHAPDPQAINIVLDPGAAFGTGSHPTTRLCLKWLQANIRAGFEPSMLDYGCGSGILAIAAKKLGSGETRGTDIDVQAVEAARYNAQQNDVAIAFSTSDTRLDFQADITVANILANPLRVLAPALASHTRIGGQFALAGILDEQASDIIEIYRPWFDLSVWQAEEGWSCIAGVRHS